MKHFIYALVCIGFVVAHTSCTRSYQAATYSSGTQDSFVKGDKKGKKSNHAKRKIIYTAFMEMYVENYEEAADSIGLIAKRFDGYVQASGKETIVRVKQAHLKKAMEQMERLGNVVRQSTRGQDVTEEYYDVKTRLQTAEKVRDRYLALLTKASDVSDMLKIEKELERITGQIDLYKGKMNRMDHLSDYSTITVNMFQKEKPGILGYVGVGLFKMTKWLFVRS